ncbi:MAG: exopolysaccharide biosynthesis protein [Elusimicrobia bacterium]|nr:exopolysaccharide biosynthesis protein [Elusimicrobiota bacterium]
MASPRPSEDFARLAADCAGETVTFRRLLGDMTPRDQALLTLMLSAAFLHPVPMPGISTLFGAVIALCGWRMSRGKGPWIPARWIDKPLPARFLRAVFGVFARLLGKLESVLRPRARFLAAHPALRRANGAGLMFVGFLILVPLPPPTNFPPAIAGFLLSAGILEDDLLFVALGWLAVALNAVIFGLIAVYGLDAIGLLWDRLTAA